MGVVDYGFQSERADIGWIVEEQCIDVDGLIQGRIFDGQAAV